MVTLKKIKSRSQKQCTKIQTCSGQRLKIKKEDFSKIRVLDIASPGAGELGPCGFSSWHWWQRPQSSHQSNTWRPQWVNSSKWYTAALKDQNLHNPFISKGALLVWFFPAVTELMSGELIASTKALVTVFTGEWFLRSEWKHQTLTQHSQVINSHKHNIDFYNTPLDPDLFFFMSAICIYSAWLPRSHLPILCVCKDEPLTSMTYWMQLYNQKMSKHSFSDFATSPPSLIIDVRCGVVVTDENSIKGGRTLSDLQPAAHLCLIYLTGTYQSEGE